jgi:hypothetical protein
MDLKGRFAQKMLEEKLDFLPLKESLDLYNSGIVLKTEFSWVMHSEEIEDSGNGMTTEELFKAYDEIYGLDNKDYLKIGKSQDEFDEFTLELCPAPTYIDLIK